MTYKATIRHHSIASATVISVGDDLTAAKRAATREFGDGYIGHEIIIMGQETPENPSGIVARKRNGDREWSDC